MVQKLGNSSVNPAAPLVRTSPTAGHTVKAQDTAPANDGGSLPDPTGGLTGKVFDALKQAGGNVNEFRKKHPILTILISILGLASGWKLDELAHRAAEKAGGNAYAKYGEDQYNSLKDQGTDQLVAALKQNHNLTLTDHWKDFCTYTVLAQVDQPTLDKDNKPVVLTALAGNSTADKDALHMLSARIRTIINGTPAKQEFYQPVIDALKTNGVTV